MIEVLHPGLLTTVQDLGRHGYTHLGVSPAGAADPLALRVGNLLLGNAEGAPALETTLLGLRCRFHQETAIAVAGAACDASLAGRPLPLWQAARVRAGEELVLGSARQGARTYLCVAGGVAVPDVLGSAAAHLPSGLGGRALRKGDRVPLPAASAPRLPRLPERWQRALLSRSTLRLTAGLQIGQFAADAVFRLLAAPFMVRPESNRLGLRLAGPALGPATGGMQSEGVPLGAVQVPPSGEPILLFVDAQTTGGYPVIGCVISADLPSVGQLRPGDRVRFAAVTGEEALAALHEQAAMLAAIRAELA